MIIPTSEGETTEFKESSADLNSILESACAFSNTNGGTVYIGVHDNGLVTGISIGKKTLEELAGFISQNTSPKIYPEIKIEIINDKQIILLIVETGSDKPYLAKGTGFKRVGRTNIKMDIYQLEKYILKKHTDKLNFDQIVSDGTIEDVDHFIIARFIEKAKILRSQIFSSTKPFSILSNLRLISNKKLLNGAILCFGKNPTPFFPQATLRAAVFRNQTIIHHQLIEGNIFDVIDKTQDFVMSNIKRSYIIKGTQREDVFEYPPEAVREGIVNAIIHRDYFSNASCYLSIYEDRIEIRNPGLLADDLRIADLKRPGHISIPRNKLLAHVAHLFGYIEKWGTGTTKIVNLCRATGMKDPLFQEFSGHFSLTLFNSKIEFSTRQKKAFSFLTTKRSSLNYAKYFKITQRSAISDLSELISLGLVDKLGKGKNTQYIIKN
ncbi:MAG: putative DNA binding domain-containing protein [Candidatus Micrarchaeota archaeon]|nr:putative DNA binding domain-containing protein [Candidatus Micrarchaeota archaeon]